MSNDVQLNITSKQLNINVKNENQEKKEKKVQKKKTFESYIPKEHVEEAQKQSEKLNEVESEFSVQENKIIFSDIEVAKLEELCAQLRQQLDVMGIKKLTGIQAKSLKPILSGKDVLIKSETGSGKTLSFLIPVVQNLYNESLKKKAYRQDGTAALILAPTRELCIQIQKVVQKVCHKFPWMVSGTLMGGEKKKSEKARLRKGIYILIATPGRLLDHLKSTSTFKYELCKHVILDEADRLLDMGFEKDIRTCFDLMRKKWKEKPQVVMCSATLHKKLRTLADDLLTQPEMLGFTSQETQMKIAEDVDIFKVPSGLSQFAIMAPCKLRLVILAAFLKLKTQVTDLNKEPCKILVFLSCCESVNFHYELFKKTKINERDGGEPLFDVPLFKLHGNMEQKERTKVYFEFLEQESGILLATDVACRGLDLPKLNWIVQYDTPGAPKDYIHRIGRTARLGFKGSGVIFLMPHELAYKQLLQKFKLTLSDISAETVLSNLVLVFKRRTTDTMQAANILQKIFEEVVQKDEELKRIGMNAYQAYMRAYSTHTHETKFIFHLKNLHKGHVAASFALTEKPTNFRKIQTREAKKEAKKKGKKGEKKMKMNPVASRIEKFKQFQKGTLQRSRPKIEIPQELKKTKQSEFFIENSNVENLSTMLSNPFSKKRKLNVDSEFSSGLDLPKKKVKSSE